MHSGRTIRIANEVRDSSSNRRNILKEVRDSIRIGEISNKIFQSTSINQWSVNQSSINQSSINQSRWRAQGAGAQGPCALGAWALGGPWARAQSSWLIDWLMIVWLMIDWLIIDWLMIHWWFIDSIRKSNAWHHECRMQRNRKYQRRANGVSGGIFESSALCMCIYICIGWRWIHSSRI